MSRRRLCLIPAGKLFSATDAAIKLLFPTTFYTMKTVYEITEADQEALREPRGDVVQEEELITELENREYHRLICVGDRVSIDVAKSDLEADIFIVDGKVERETIEHEDNLFDTERVFDAVNSSGTITEEAWNTTRELFAHTCRTTLHIEGEEDLLALPSILFASPDSLIVYGDWQNGAVILEPDTELKSFARRIVGFEPFPRVIVGGTWDRFHAGHRYLLLTALENGKHIDVGVTTEAYVDEQQDGQTEPFETRKQHVEQFLDMFGRADDVDILALDDFRGNAVDVDQGVLMVTEDTLANAKKINQERLSDHRTPLKIAAVQQITAEDGNVISSTRIRAGEIDRNGHLT